jgi:GT2 family glycosyltransferase
MNKSNKMLASVVIPTYKRKQLLYNCLRSLSLQTYPKESFEVIVVNDGILEESETIRPDLFGIKNLYVFSKEHEGPAAARNYGVKMAKGELIAFTDDDCSPKENWIERIVSQYKLDNDPVIGGKTLNLLTNNLYSEASQIISDIVYNHFNKDPDNALFLASNNFAIKRDLFNELGGFDCSFKTSSSEDRDFCNRLTSNGRKLKLIDDAVVYHGHELTFKSFFLQHFNYGRGAYLYQKKRSQRGSGGLFKDTSFHLDIINIVGYPFTKVNLKNAIPLALLLIVWQIANTAGFFAEYISNKMK